MVTIIFESHGTTIDNENHIASGWADAELSELGIRQAKELGERYKNDALDAIFCSDLQRSYETAESAFGNRFEIVKDERLRECNYGDLTQHSSEEVDKEKPNRIKEPFPNGESYEKASERMRAFLRDLIKDYDGKRVMIVGHRATQYGLERWIEHIPLAQAIPAPWKWQPGWEYTLFETSLEMRKL
jgi:broad specificity phosphatase PhoE